MAITNPALDWVTYERYMTEWETEPPTLQPCEIVDGERAYMPSPSLRHQTILKRLTRVLLSYESAGVGELIISPMDLLIRRFPLRVRQPDLMFLSRSRAEAQEATDGPLTVAPELVIEILSESDTPARLADKLADYTALSVTECWLVRPNDETMERLRLAPGGPERTTFSSGDILTSLAFPALTIPVSDLFTA